MANDDFSQTMIQVQAAQQGDREAMDALFERFVPRVARIVAARTGQQWRNLGIDDDIVQQTMLDAFVALREGRIRNNAAFTSWIAVCVQHNVRDRVRGDVRQKRGGERVSRFADLNESMLTGSMLEGGDASASQVATAHELEERLEQMLCLMNARYREVIALRAYCFMSYEDIAEEMDLPSANTANVLFLRARKELQRRMSE